MPSQGRDPVLATLPWPPRGKEAQQLWDSFHLRGDLGEAPENPGGPDWPLAVFIPQRVAHQRHRKNDYSAEGAPASRHLSQP